MVQPLISIVTVTWNCANTIDRTLVSVQEIKSEDVEYIVIDGVSTDGTLERLNAYDGLVDYLVSEKDSGIYNAMNKGAQLAKGKYIMFLNGDDNLLKDGFIAAKAILAQQQPDVLSCQSEAVSERGENRAMIKPSLWRIRFFNTIPHPSTFVATHLQKKFQFREQFEIAADYDLFLRLFVKQYHFVICDETIARHYRGGFSNNLPQVILETRKIRRENLGFLHYWFSRILESFNYFKHWLAVKTGYRSATGHL